MAWHPFRHLGLKCLAVLLALGLWFVTSGERTVRTVRVPLAFRNMPVSLEITGNPPETVDVRLRGSSGQLDHLVQGDVIALIDLTDAQPGSRVVNLQPDAVSAPFGVEVSLVLTPRVAFELERAATVTVTVVPAVEGEPAAGFARAAMKVDPATVSIVGPESRVRRLQSVMTEPVSITGATATVYQTVSISLGDPTLRLLQPQEAHATIEIAAELDQSVPPRTVLLRHLREGLQADATPAAVAIKLRGSGTILRSVKDAELVPYVDLAGLGPGQYNLEVHVDRPGGLTAADAEPGMISVRIR